MPKDQAAEVTAIREEAQTLLAREFGLRIAASTLTLHDAESWKKFKSEQRYEEKENFQLLGRYCVQPREAHVWIENPNWVGTLYHELYGHGLYYECVSTSRHKPRIRPDFPSNRGSVVPWGVGSTRWESSEGFAVWMERFLCERTGRAALWSRIQENMPADYRAAFELCVAAENNLSRYGFLRQMGFSPAPRRTDLTDVVRAVYGSRTETAGLILSDKETLKDRLNFLIVTDSPIHPSELPWRSFFEMRPEEFITRVKDREPILRNRLRDAEFLQGDRYALRQATERYGIDCSL